MSERSSIGQILKGLGRITEEDVGTALEYQRDNGGYFGEALLACGLISEGELEWGLASQFDLPFVFPEAESIDYEAATLVTPEWALTHLTLPIMKTRTTLTVIVESPTKTTAVEDLRALTELDIELALASPSKIRELIREVYARGAAADEGEVRTPLQLADALDEAVQVAAPRWGISARGERATVWWDDGGTIRRRPLSGDWETALERTMQPGPQRMARDRTRSDWSGHVTRGGVLTPVDVRFLADESGQEYLFLPRHDETELEGRFPSPPAGVLSEIRLLARSGKARFVVTSEPSSLGHEILPHLPTLLLDPSWRSLYINARDRPAADEVFSFQLPEDPGTWSEQLDSLRSFHFDVVTVDLSGGAGDWPGSALDVASIAFLLWVDGEDARPAYEAGIRWRLHIVQDDEQLEWTLEPLTS